MQTTTAKIIFLENSLSSRIEQAADKFNRARISRDLQAAAYWNKRAGHLLRLNAAFEAIKTGWRAANND